MGNPSIQPQSFTPAQRTPTAHNGILAWVPAEIIAGGSRGLPTAAAGEQDQHQVAVEVPGIGLVLITYRHGRSRFWHWKATWAEKGGAKKGVMSAHA